MNIVYAGQFLRTCVLEKLPVTDRKKTEEESRCRSAMKKILHDGRNKLIIKKS